MRIAALFGMFMKPTSMPRTANLTFPTLVGLFALVLAGCSEPAATPEPSSTTGPMVQDTTSGLWFEGERHLANMRQLTFGGNNAEAYWNASSDQLVFQSDFAEINPQGCDQIFVMNSNGSTLDGGSAYRLVSTGKGRTTCSYFLPDGRIIYGSTHEGAAECPAPVFSAAGRYVWPIYTDYDIFVANPDGSGP